METESESGKRLTAADVNEMAQALDDGRLVSGAGVHTSTQDAAAPSTTPPGTGDIAGLPNSVAQTAGDNPLEGEEREAQLHVFPPDIAPTVEIGGNPEEQSILREEYRQT